jgi:hypothetical protein
MSMLSNFQDRLCRHAEGWVGKAEIFLAPPALTGHSPLVIVGLPNPARAGIGGHFRVNDKEGRSSK